MNFGAGTYGLGFAAGALSTLSPCVLPLVPVLLASAVNAHRWGVLALGGGLALTFALVGTFLATVGSSLGLDPDIFRVVGALIMAAFGLILLIPKLQDAFASSTSRLSDSGSQLLARLSFDGMMGQFMVGSVLGVVWSPCVGPTLGAATTLASQGKNLGQIVVLMALFGFGAAAPLVLLGFLSRASLMKVRGRLVHAGNVGKRLFGVAMVGLGILIATGADKSIEVRILDWTPDWLTALTTKF